MTFNSNFHQRHCHLAIWEDIFLEDMIRVQQEMLRWADQQMKLETARKSGGGEFPKLKRKKE